MRHSWEEQNAEKCIGCAQEQQLVPCTQVRRDNLGQQGRAPKFWMETRVFCLGAA